MLERFCRTVILFFAACFLIACGRAASFTASLDRDTITLGEQATLSLKFDGVQPQNVPALPAVPGLQFQYVGPSQFVQLHQRPDEFQRHLQLPRDAAARRRVHHSGDDGRT